MKNLAVWGMFGFLGAFGVFGCSSTSDPGAGSGGGGGGPAAGPPAQAAISFTIDHAPNDKSCPAQAQLYQVGAPQGPSLTDPGKSVVDGVDRNLISCSVKGPAPYTFSGSIQSTSTGTAYPVTVTFANGQISADGSGTFRLAIYTPQLAATYTSDSCTVNVVNDQLKGGALWASFSCPTITTPPDSVCTLDGIVVLENCEGS